jgi:hypothetical protein
MQEKKRESKASVFAQSKAAKRLSLLRVKQ